MKPTYTHLTEVQPQLLAALTALRADLAPEDGSDIDTALCVVEVFCAVSLRVMAKTNPSKIRDEARTVEIMARMNGFPAKDHA